MGNNASNPDLGGKTIFDFEVNNANHEPVLLSTYKGKNAYIIVNVAR